MRYTGPKNKVARREGVDLGMKTTGSKAQASLLKKINIVPGQHGAKKKRKTSERFKQLRQKQKLRALFGITETHLKNYFQKAVKMKGNTAVLLSSLLEKRLDNTVYRLGFAPTRSSARQLVSHRHIAVNGKVINISSYQLSKGETVSFASDKSKKIPYIETALGVEDASLVKWLKKKGDTGQFIADPTEEEIEKQVDLRSVIEFYSR